MLRGCDSGRVTSLHPVRPRAADSLPGGGTDGTLPGADLLASVLAGTAEDEQPVTHVAPRAGPREPHAAVARVGRSRCGRPPRRPRGRRTVGTPGRGRAARLGGPARRRGHRHRVREVPGLPAARADAARAGPARLRPLPGPDQGAGPRPAGVGGGARRSVGAAGGLRRGHPGRGTGLGAAALAVDRHQPGHAAPRDPARPPEVVQHAAPGRVRGHRRVPRLSRGLRFARRARAPTAAPHLPPLRGRAGVRAGLGDGGRSRPRPRPGWSGRRSRRSPTTAPPVRVPPSPCGNRR